MLLIIGLMITLRKDIILINQIATEGTNGIMLIWIQVMYVILQQKESIMDQRNTQHLYIVRVLYSLFNNLA